MRLTHYPSGQIQIQPRGGRSNVRFQTTLLNKLHRAGASVLPLTIDSNTRLEFYEVASKLHDESLIHNRETLNGFPLMSVPDIELAGMLNSFSKPFSLRHGSPIAHKLVTRALSFGIDEIEGGPLTYLLPYSRKVPIAEAINSWKLVENNCAQALSRNGGPILKRELWSSYRGIGSPIHGITGINARAFFCSRKWSETFHDRSTIVWKY